MNSQEILEKLYEITKEFSKINFDINSEKEKRQVLYAIVSESVQATNYIIWIEDEFNVEFDDEDIDLDFFKSFDRIVEIINKHL